MQFVNTLVLLAAINTAAALPSYSLPQRHWLQELSLKDVNGGTTCAACAILTGLVSQLAEVHNASIAEALEMFCNFMPGQYRGGWNSGPCTDRAPGR